MKVKISEIVFVFIYVIFLLVFFIGPVRAQDWAVDTLAGAQYPGAIRQIDNRFGIGIFAETFGDAFPIVKKELENGRSFVRVNLMWSDTHTFGDKDIPTIKRLGNKYEQLCKLYGTRIEVATFTEHNLSNPDKYHSILKAVAPHCVIVNTPWRGALSRIYKNELHGTHSVPTDPLVLRNGINYSFDGTNAVDANVEAYKNKWSKADRFFFWDPRENCRWSMNDNRSRAERIKNCAKPTVDYHKSITYLSTNKGATSVPKGWIIKSHSEHHGSGETKGDKLMVISQICGREIVLKRSAKIVAKLPYFGSYQGGGFRYYHTQFGYKLGAGLDLFINGKKYGKINGGFRDGSYR